MQTTYHIKAGKIDMSLLESIKGMFKEEESVTITVESEDEEDQYQIFLKSQELQKKYPPIRIDHKLDLSALANEVNL